MGPARTAARLGLRAVRTYTKYRSDNKPEPRAPMVSQYHENRTLYRRRKMPYRKKKRYVRFKKRVQNINYGAVKKSVMYHKDSVDFISSVDAQATGDFTLGTGFQTGFPAGYDIYRCCDLIANIATPSPAADAVTNFIIKDMIMNVTFYNAGGTPAYIDLYWFYSRNNCVTSPNSLFNEGLTIPTVTSGKLNIGTNEQVAMTSGGWSSTVSSSTFGMTPFMSRPFCQNNKIYKVTKHLIAAGTTIEFQVRQKRSRVIREPSELINGSFCILKGISQGFVPVVYGVPNAATGSAGQYASAANIYARREVTYKMHPIDVGSHEFIATVT